MDILNNDNSIRLEYKYLNGTRETDANLTKKTAM